MKLLVFSDSHSNTIKMHEIIQEQSWDAVIHLGDCYDDFLEIQSCYDIPMYGVVGNVDYLNEGPVQTILEFDGMKMLITHGHRYKVKQHLLSLRQKAIEEEVRIALFGHTHVPYVEEGEVILMNPGSISRPRNHLPSYGVIEMKNNLISTEIIYI